MYRDTSSVDCAPRELTHACSRSDIEACDMCYVFNVNLTSHVHSCIDSLSIYGNK